MDKFVANFGDLKYYHPSLGTPLNPAIFPRPVPNMDMPTVFDVNTIANPLAESCATRFLSSAIMGYGLGNALGLLLGSYEGIAPPIPLPGERELPKVPWGEYGKLGWRTTAEKCKYWRNNFMVVTAVFSGVECVVEKSRGKHDMINGTMAGCATGAALAAGQGPQAMCLGCVGFAAFSAAIEHFMDR